MSFQSKDYTPTVNDTGNAESAQVIDNKNDTVAGDSIVSLEKQILALGGGDNPVPGIDAVTNAHVEDVVGNKDDTVAGNSIVSLEKQALAAIALTALQVDVGNAQTDTLKSVNAKIGDYGDDLGMMIGSDGAIDLSTQVGYGATAGRSCKLDMDDVIADITDIKAVTDVLPDAGALTSLAQDLTVAKEATLGVPSVGGVTIAGDIAAVKAVVDTIPTSLVDISSLALKVDLGDASGDTLTSVVAKLGDDPLTVKARLDALDLAVAGIVVPPAAVPAQDEVANTTTSEVVGNKTDTVTGTSLVSLEKQNAAAIAALVVPDAAGVVATFIGVAGANLTDVASADIGAASGSTLGSVYGILGNPATSLSAQIAAIPVVTPDAAGTAAGLVAGLATTAEVEATTLNQNGGSRANTTRLGGLVRYIADTVYTANNQVAASAMGNTQVFRKAVNQAANAGDYTLASANTGDLLIKSLTVRASAATSADLTDIAVYADNKLVTLITQADGAKANLAAAGNQVGTNPIVVMLPVGQAIVMTLTGTGATNVVFTVDIEYIAANGSGGYLV